MSSGVGNILSNRLWFAVKIALLTAIALVAVILVGNSATQAQAPSVKEVTHVSAGYDTACAVVNYWAECWGSNDQGRLGTGDTKQKTATSPVRVADNKNAVPADPGVCKSKNWFGQCTSYSRQPAPAKPASAMAGLEVTKVSVGKTHVCAIADARVFCWGDNSRGQLGDRTNKDSSVPVAVDVQPEDVAAVYANPNPCGGWFQPACKPQLKEAAKPKSSLGQKEIMDILTGEYFTCALATDGMVSCWGEGDDGRLGAGGTKDTNYPVNVASKPSGLAGKRGVKLAKVSESTACVMAVPEASESEAGNGNPYCWGYGVGDGTIPSGKGASTVKCSKSSPKTKPTGTSKVTYFNANEPVKISDSKLMSDITSASYVTGLGSDKKLYYWGMHGHKELTEYEDVTSCRIDPCRAAADSIQLAGYTSTTRTTTQRNSSGGVSRNTNHYSGRATPTTFARINSNTQNKGCDRPHETHYGYTKVHRFTEIGSITPVAAPSTSLTNNVRLMSGDVTGLVCGVVATGAYCDANGTGIDEGQTGSNYVKQCTTKTVLLIFKSTTCDPAPTGPQKVTTAGWLGSRTIENLSTGGTGYTCALAGSSVACWGVNNKGQLGTGDTKNRLVPTQVSGL